GRQLLGPAPPVSAGAGAGGRPAGRGPAGRGHRRAPPAGPHRGRLDAGGGPDLAAQPGARTPDPPRPAGLPPLGVVARAGPAGRAPPLPRPRGGLGRIDPPQPGADPARRPVHGGAAGRRVRRTRVQLRGATAVTTQPSLATQSPGPDPRPVGLVRSWV